MTLQAGHVASLIDKEQVPGPVWDLINRLHDYVYSSPENVEVVHNFDPEVVRLLIAYHYLKKTLAWHSTEGEIDGLLMWYRCSQDWTWDDIKNWTPDDKDGDSFFLAFCWAKPGILRELCLQLIAQAPDVLTSRIYSLRERKDGPTLVEWSQKIFVRVLKNHGQEISSSTDARPHRREPEHGKIPVWLRLGGRPRNNGSGIPKKTGTGRKTVRTRVSPK